MTENDLRRCTNLGCAISSLELRKLSRSELLSNKATDMYGQEWLETYVKEAKSHTRMQGSNSDGNVLSTNQLSTQ